MNSFTLTAIGNLARNPELVAKGDTAYTRFCLVGNDYAGKDEEGAAREVVTSLWFVAFGPLGEALVRNSRKGDQLIIEARVRANNWTDKQGEKQYDHSFVVQGFRFGAPGKTKREERESRREDGLHRVDEQGNGPDSQAGTGDSGDGSAGARRGAEANVDTQSKTGAGGNADTNANGAAIRPGTDTNAGVDANASAGAKSGVNRANRRAAASAA
ncbi:MAG: single-stranded DNA-binding protein [Steroidobacteraceae bacterium]